MLIDGSTIVVLWIVGFLVSSGLVAGIFYLVFGISKQHWYQAKQLEITIRMGKKQGLTDEEIDEILNRPARKPTA